MPVEFSNRGGLRSLLDDARRELMASLEGLSEEQMTDELENGWSVKDVVAHVAMWDEMVLPDLIRAVRGHQSLFKAWDHESFTDQWNHIQLELRRGFPLEHVMEEFSESRQAIMSFLDSVAEERLTSGPIPASCAIQAEHDREHAAQIRAWREQKGA